MRESLKDALKDAASLYNERSIAQHGILPMLKPQQFNVQKLIDESTNRTYWEAEFFREPGSKGSCVPWYTCHDAVHIYCDIMNNSRFEVWVKSIGEAWQDAWNEKVQVASRISCGR